MPYDPETHTFTRTLRFVDDRAQGDRVTRGDLDAAFDDLTGGINNVAGAAELSAATSALFVSTYYKDLVALRVDAKVWPVGTVLSVRTGEVFKVVPAGMGDFDHPVSGIGLSVVAIKWGVSPKSFGAVGDGVANDNLAVQLWVNWLAAQPKGAATIGLVDGHFLITELVDFTPVKLKIEGLSRRSCGFTQQTDNVGIIKIGGTDIDDHGKHYSGFFAKYLNVQPVENTSAICVLVEYFSYSKLTEFDWFGGYRGIAALNTPADNVFYSSTMADIKGNRCSYRPYQFSSGTGTGNTGNIIHNLYYSGLRANVASATCDIVYLFERMTECAISQINAEWCTPNRVLACARGASVITAMHLEGVSARSNGLGLIEALGSQITISGLTVKTVNFSGGDPETKNIGAITYSALFEVTSEAQGGAGRIIVTSGRNQNCTPATINTRVARSLDGWSVTGQSVEIIQWEDTDDIFAYTSGIPKAQFLLPPTSPHLPILTRWGHWSAQIYARGKDPGSPSGAVLWEEIEDTNACYDPATGFFTAPKSGLVDVSFCLVSAAAGICELKLFDVAGNERPAYRHQFASGSSIANRYYTTGSARLEILRGEKVRIDNANATVASDFSQVTFAMGAL